MKFTHEQALTQIRNSFDAIVQRQNARPDWNPNERIKVDEICLDLSIYMHRVADTYPVAKAEFLAERSPFFREQSLVTDPPPAKIPEKTVHYDLFSVE